MLRILNKDKLPLGKGVGGTNRMGEKTREGRVLEIELKGSRIAGVGVERQWRHGRSGDRRGCWGLLFLLVLLAGVGLVPAPAAALEGSVNINSAGVEKLQELPFVGEVRARAIVEQRREHGPFETVDDLLASPVIGPRTLEAIRPYLSLSGPSTLARPSDKDGSSLTEPGPLADGQQVREPVSGPLEAVNVRRLIVTRPGEIQVLCDGEYYPALLHLLKSASRQVGVAMFVFRATGTKGNRPTRIAEELVNARQRGVEVEVILEHSAYDEDLTQEHRRLARNLRQGGVAVHFGPRDTTTHNKIVVIDQRFTLMGSHNLTHSALSYNHECSLLIDSRELAARLRAYLDELPAK